MSAIEEKPKPDLKKGGAAKVVSEQSKMKKSRLDKRKKVVVRGFYGNGNMGDEALLQSIMAHLGDEFAYKFAINTLDKPGVLTREPYISYPCINSLNRGEVMKDDVCGFFLGGGGLGLGFGYNQLICARRAGKAIIHSGVHIHDDFFSVGDPLMIEASSAFLKLAHMTTVRDRLSLDVMQRYGVPGEWMPDWAFGLDAEPWDAPVPDDYIVVTFRSRPPNDVELITPWLKGVQEFAQSMGLPIVALPYDKGDARLTEKLGYGDSMLADLYFDPAKAKHVISRAKAVISFGRFHPIVFALSENVPAFAVDYWFARETGHKTTLLLREEGHEAGIFHTGHLNSFTGDELGKRYAILADKMKSKPFDAYKGIIEDVASRMRTLLRKHSSK